MQVIKFIKQSKINNSFNNEYIKSKFDFHKNEIIEEFHVDVDMPKEWSIGAIIGNSGTGKSSIAKELFTIEQFEYGNESVVDELGYLANIDEIIKTFNSVGFSSAPSWLKSYHVLSNGQKMRVDLARAILSKKEIICFDEFTSVIDREVAKIGSYATAKYIRKNNKKFVAVSCHYDVLDWLEPDWVIDMNKQVFCRGNILPTKDPKSNAKSNNVVEMSGISLGDIII